MKKYLKKTIALLTMLSLTIPLLFSFPVFAADESKEEILNKGYMSLGFGSIDERIMGNDIISSMELMYEKDGYALYGDTHTGEVICLKLKPDGKGGYLKKEYKVIQDGTTVTKEYYDYDGYWTTNPYDIGSSTTPSGAVTSEAEKMKLYSQVNIAFTTIAKGTSQVFYSYQDAALSNQIKMKKVKTGVRTEYILGKQSVKYIVPRMLTEKRMNDVIERLRRAGVKEETIQNRIGGFYEYYEVIDENTSEARKESIEEFNEKYPGTKGKAVYSIRSNIQLQELERLEKEYIFKRISYTLEEVEEAHNELGYVVEDEVSPLFKMAIEYGLDKDGVLIRCNAANIRFDTSKYQLDDVYLLPNSGSGNVKNDGFILMPDGSGSSIDFSTVRSQIFDLTDSVYGQDYAFSKITGANKEIIRMPVFGLSETIEKKNTDGEKEQITNGYLAIITEGDSLSRISVKRESTSSYARAFTLFNPRPKDEYMLTGGISVNSSNKWSVEAKRKYVDNYRIKVCILTGDNASYSGMAKKYRDYLYEKGDLTKLDVKEGSDIPLFIETLGAIDTTKRILGVPVGTKAALTTFDDTVSMLESLKNDSNIKNVVLKMSGWANGGMTSSVPTDVEVEDVLGGEDGFNKLVSYAKENSIQLFPDFDFVYSYKDEMFDGFDANEDLARTIDKRNAYKREYKAVSQSFSYVAKGIISANKMSSFYEQTFSAYSKYGLNSIGITTLGDSLSSDFNEDAPLNREDSRTLIVKLLDKVKTDNENVLLAGGNAYTLKYGTHFVDIPLENSMYRYSTKSIPFYGMVLHGSKEFSGTALNLSGNFNESVLRIIENGASPYFVFAMKNTSELKNIPSLSQYYSVRYAIWYDDVVKAYNKINTALKDVRTAYIDDYEVMDEANKLIKVSYDNGISFYINYLNEDVTINDNGTEYTVKAEDYLKIGADGKVVTK